MKHPLDPTTYPPFTKFLGGLTYSFDIESRWHFGMSSGSGAGPPSSNFQNVHYLMQIFCFRIHSLINYFVPSFTLPVFHSSLKLFSLYMQNLVLREQFCCRYPSIGHRLKGNRSYNSLNNCSC